MNYEEERNSGSFITNSRFPKRAFRRKCLVELSVNLLVCPLESCATVLWRVLWKDTPTITLELPSLPTYKEALLQNLYPFNFVDRLIISFLNMPNWFGKMVLLPKLLSILMFNISVPRLLCCGSWAEWPSSGVYTKESSCTIPAILRNM